MKNLILQKEFISDLFCLSNEGCIVIDDLLQFLSKDFRDYDLVCDFISYEEYEMAALENPILESMLDKFNKISYITNLNESFSNDSFYVDLPERNIFLTTLNVDDCKNLTEERGYLFVSKDDIKDSWSFFSECTKGINLKVTNSTTIKENDRLDNWSKFARISHPITSIIIFDKHLFKEIIPEDVSINLIPLLVNLIPRKITKNKIHLTFISEIKIGLSLKEYYDKINKELSSKGISNIVINIVRHNKALYPLKFEGLHARFIITNYLNIMPDASINFFKKNGSVINVANIPITLNLVGYHNDSFNKDIEDIKAYFKKAVNSHLLDDLNYNDLYYPNKINPLLN